jgi:predicted lipoprotein with Yx(FWY)xxD motif
MKVKIALVAAAAVLAAAALGSVGLAGGSSGSRSRVNVTQSKLGRILVDSRGRTLYLFAKDKTGKSSCYGACAAYWPPLIATAKPTAGSGARTSLLATIKRADGRRQVTYKGHPLYLFVKDTKKGQTNGEELNVYGAEWYAVSPAGAKVEKTAAASSSDDDSGGYNGYVGY